MFLIVVGGILGTFIPFIIAIILYIGGHCTPADQWVKTGFIIIFVAGFLIGFFSTGNGWGGVGIGAVITLFYYLFFGAFLFSTFNPYWKFNTLDGKEPELAEIETILEKRESIDLHGKIYNKSMIYADKFKSFKYCEDTVKIKAKTTALNFVDKREYEIKEFKILKKKNDLNQDLMEFSMIISIEVH